ncbi:MAG: SIMPL domain-containing protein [Pseudomonas sp.]
MHRLTRLTAVLAFTFAGLTSLPAAAQDIRFNQVALRAEVSQDVAHDLMHVVLFSEGQSSDPAKLAAQTTETLNGAVAQARRVKNVTAKLGSRHSSPIYDDKGQTITGWRERAELRLESADFVALSSLTSELLSDLKMASMNFAISDPVRKASEDQLLKQAIAAFKARAQLATDALGGKDYKLVNLNLNSAGFQPVRAMQMDAMASSRSLSKAAPVQDIEAGTSEVTVNADGVIEVQMP